MEKSTERKIIEMRSGLIGSGKPYTLREVGVRNGLSKERVRQIEKRFWKSIEQKEKVYLNRKRYKQLSLIKSIDYLDKFYLSLVRCFYSLIVGLKGRGVYLKKEKN